MLLTIENEDTVDGLIANKSSSDTILPKCWIIPIEKLGNIEIKKINRLKKQNFKREIKSKNQTMNVVRNKSCIHV